MQNTFNRASFVLGLLSFSLPVLAMELPENAEKLGTPCSSVCIRGEIKPSLKQEIFSDFRSGFENINGKNNKNSILQKWNGEKISQGNHQYRHQTQDKVFFEYKNSDSYHVSLAIVHHPEKLQDPASNAKLDQLAQTYLIALADKYLEPEKMINSVHDAGHCFQFLTMVHGYDAQRNEINKTYFNNLGNLSVDFPDGISNIHFALRHGTHGIVRDIVENDLMPVINSKNGVFHNPYEGKYDKFVGHILTTGQFFDPGLIYPKKIS